MKKAVLGVILFIPLLSFAQLADSVRRVVRLQGTVNFRDAGGYQTADGRQVTWDRVYRSADISHLTDEDLEILKQRHIASVIDFRGVRESAVAPDRLPAGVRYLLCPAGSDSLPDPAQMAALIKQGQFMEQFYSNIKPLGARYRPLFQQLLAMPEREAVLFHCTGGRDRTGMANALFLYALGVPLTTIEADFTASNTYLQPMYGKMFKGMSQATGLDTDTIRQALELRPEWLQRMFAAIKLQYGSIERFFALELGVGPDEIALLRKKYTH
ncbi:tyrosine-protein phosphatase [Chitinophaga pendula]|uniref:tyrosine-protein phosphatase n=1 Tax=Chitinophaga TaxID=79328 RepID=UPI000BB02ECE|nr:MULTISPECIES: tyrosine-protein phosphatase [Chitinophaga]ASZ13695.1 protein tyrosine phosphatase [Chitinophaga sp. MD30]UCJ08689.1 tyrosine-protein phosphatase [Chitinophaga pendula]